MEKRKIYVSTGAFIGRANGRDYTKIFDVVENIKCDGLEFMMYNAWYEKIGKICDDLIEKGVSFSAFHADKMIGEYASTGDFDTAKTLMDINAASAKRLGIEKAVLHLWNGKPSDLHFENNLEIYPYLCEIADKYGVKLCVENVVCAVGSPIERLATIKEKYGYATFTFDTKMSEFHKELDRVYTDFRYLFDDGSVSHVHINDYKGAYKDFSSLKTLHLGDGDIDFARFASFIKSTGYSGAYTLECSSIDENGEPLFDKMIKSTEYANKLLNE